MDDILYWIDYAIRKLEALLRTKKRPSKVRTKMENKIKAELESRIGKEAADKYWPGIFKDVLSRIEERP